jgi:hypothetical protein
MNQASYAFFCIYKLLKRVVEYSGVEVLVPESWQLVSQHVAERSNSAELIEEMTANPRSTYIMVRIEIDRNDPDAVPALLHLEEGLKLALATERYLEKA